MKYASMIDRIIANSALSIEHFHNGTPCWQWWGKRITNRRGYHYPVLTMRRDGKTVNVKVHRLVCEVFNGEALINGMVAMHACDNTLCVNPLHVSMGTQSANMKECYAKGRTGGCTAPLAQKPKAE